jgi:DNA-binding MltR family transcriptional regulator
MARRAIPTIDLETKYRTAFVRAINETSPLACALIATAFIENALMTLLTNFFVDRSSSTVDNMFKPAGLLGDLSKSASLAYCLGFINKTMYENARAIGDIRNFFAHSHDFIDFDHPDLKEPLKRLTLPHAKVALWSKGGEDFWKTVDSIPRIMFTKVTMSMFSWIMFAALTAKHREPPGLDEVWPPKKNPKTPPNHPPS